MLAYLLQVHFRDIFPERLCHYIPLTATSASNPVSFETVWNNEFPRASFTDFLNQNKPSFLIFDEVQSMYTFSDNIFWKELKNAVDTVKYSNVKIICFAGYGSQSLATGSSTPIQFNKNNGVVFSMGLLQLNPDEIDEFCAKFVLQVGVEVSQVMKETLYRNTKGHIGFLHILLEGLKRCQSEKSWNAYLESFQLFKEVESSRSLAGFSSANLTDAQLAILRQIVIYGECRLTPSNDQIVSLLIRSGYIASNNDETCVFACPLISKCMQFILFSRPSLNRAISDLKSFVLASFRNFRQSQLANTLSRNVDTKVSEKFWQSEFYYASTVELPAGTYVSSEVGSSFKDIQGIIDFVIDTELNWGVEFLIETNNADEHLARFQSFGIYASANFSDYLVIEFIKKDDKWLGEYFRAEATNARIKRTKYCRSSNLWIVFYEPDFSLLYVFLPDDNTNTKPLKIQLK
jgi:hypothetical protein